MGVWYLFSKRLHRQLMTKIGFYGVLSVESFESDLHLCRKLSIMEIWHSIPTRFFKTRGIVGWKAQIQYIRYKIHQKMPRLTLIYTPPGIRTTSVPATSSNQLPVTPPNWNSGAHILPQLTSYGLQMGWPR